MPFLQAIWIVTRKDLLVEFRSREVVYTTLFFAVSVLLVFSFSFVREGVAIEGAAPGILWVAIAFSGTLALGRVFERERQNEINNVDKDILGKERTAHKRQIAQKWYRDRRGLGTV